MSPSAAELLSETRLVVHRGPYALGSWSSAQVSAVYAGILRGREKLAFVVLDDKETSALLTESRLFELPPPRRIEKGWAVITLDTVFEWSTVGILARVSTALADAGIPLGAVTAFSRDHLLVPVAQLDRALAALKPICGEVVEAP